MGLVHVLPTCFKKKKKLPEDELRPTLLSYKSQKTSFYGEAVITKNEIDLFSMTKITWQKKPIPVLIFGLGEMIKRNHDVNLIFRKTSTKLMSSNLDSRLNSCSGYKLREIEMQLDDFCRVVGVQLAIPAISSKFKSLLRDNSSPVIPSSFVLKPPYEIEEVKNCIMSLPAENLHLLDYIGNEFSEMC